MKIGPRADIEQILWSIDPGYSIRWNRKINGDYFNFLLEHSPDRVLFRVWRNGLHLIHEITYPKSS